MKIVVADLPDALLGTSTAATITFDGDAAGRGWFVDPTPLERIESVDMMRVLEHGRRVKMVATRRKTLSVDTPEDLKRVETVMKNDALFQKYRRTPSQPR